MKKTSNYAWLAAALLAGVTGFTACSSDDAADVNPTVNGESVKTAFTISITDNASKTRMAAGDVQEDGDFLGMTGIQLFPFKATPTSASTLSNSIHLGDITSDDISGNKDNKKVYSDVSFDLGVSNFLFYGHALTGGGKLEASYDKSTLSSTATVDDIDFSLVPLYTAKDEAQSAVLAALNAVNGAFPTDATYTDRIKEVGDEFRMAYEESSVIKYYAMAGSSSAVCATMEDLYNSLSKLKTTDDDAFDKVMSKIKEYFTVSGETVGEYTLRWTTDPNYPKVAGLPNGAVAVQYDGTAFAYTTASIEGLAMTSRDLYVSPAALYYFVNSPSMVSNTESTNLTDKTTDWETVKGDYTEGAVNASTRSVIVKNRIQYGVGRLDVTAKVTNEGVKDNKRNIVVVPDAGYTLTGVLIGGQKNVDWEFKPVEGNTAQVIYDNKLSGTNAAVKKGSACDVNHTLALETKSNEKERIAIELTNTGSDFYGINGKLIPAGGTFYLVAELDPASGTAPTGSTETLDQVFKQDYTTTANLTITSLANAYNIIPDLRSPKLQFGLSVDLEWQDGLTFDVEIK